MTRRAFVVGSDGPNSDLKFARSDAEKIIKLFNKRGYIIPNENKEPFIPTKLDSNYAIIERFADFLEECDFEDTIFFYFAGHGKCHENGRELHLIIDTTKYDRISSTAIKISEIINIFRTCRAKNKLIILDCCDAGWAEEEFKTELENTNCLLICASGKNENAIEFEELKGGFLSKLFVKAFENPSTTIVKEGLVLYNLFENWLLEEAENFKSKNIEKISSTLSVYGKRDQTISSFSIFELTDEEKQRLYFYNYTYNPFEETNSNNEEYFNNYYIKPEVYQKIIKKKSCIIFGLEGSGKTACRRIIEKDSKDNYVKNKVRPGVLSILIDNDDFEQFTKNPIETSRIIPFEKYINTIIQKVVSRLEDYEIDNYKFKNLFKGEFFNQYEFDTIFIIFDISLRQDYQDKKIKQLFQYISGIAKTIEILNFNIYLKIFLAAKFNQYLQNYDEFNTYEVFELYWETKDKKKLFNEIIERRLEDASTTSPKISSFSHASGGRLNESVINFIINKSKTPRKLIEKCNIIFVKIHELPNKNIDKEVLKEVFSNIDYEDYNNFLKQRIDVQTKVEKTIRILHLSDINISSENDIISFQNQLFADLKNMIKHGIDFLVVTGNVAEKALDSKYIYAVKFINELCQVFKISHNKIILAPGPHDINYDLSKKAFVELQCNKTQYINDGRYTLLKMENSNKQTALLCSEEVYENKMKFFSDFHEKVCNTSYPNKFDNQAILYPFPDEEIIILSLNSCWQFDFYFKECASINETALLKPFNILLKKDKDYSEWLKIAIWYHPFEEIKNADLLMKKLVEYGFKICFLGHIENSKNVYDYKFEYDRHTISAGKFGSTSDTELSGVPFHYNMIELDRQNKKIKINPRVKEKEIDDWANSPDAAPDGIIEEDLIIN
ncbi:Caspase-like domain-containing protein [Desulfonema limicola]|uniref:Caspase-like domain-containing protein n=1 Tax=Desulfonema limicola TaxID=45656 RepID=A0A975GEU0_9BACT|nr:caspase family protein [Desulfonema limicola]QTA78464.1 Caspase-like domain-containing protein [Desulfonema limicola]